MVTRSAINIDAFSGINSNHTRQSGQPSNGKNFVTKKGVLKSRGGCSSVTAPTNCGAVKSLHAGSNKDYARLLLEEGINLHLRTGASGDWSAIKTDLDATKTLRGTRWQQYLLLGNGAWMGSFNIEDATVAALGGTPPSMQHFANWKYRPWGWGPDYANPHLLHYAGYDGNGDISKDVWPANYNLNIGGSSVAPVLNAIPFGTHLLCLSSVGYKRVYGETEENFEVMEGGDTGVYGVDMSARVGDLVLWVGNDKKVYYYSGSQAVDISGGFVEELLAGENFANAEVFVIDAQFWLTFSNSPATGKSRAYVFDTTESAWYIFEFAFVITASVAFRLFMQPNTWYVATSGGQLIALVDSLSTDLGVTFTTEFVLGPIRVQDRTLKMKLFWLNAEPKSRFSLSIYGKGDQGEETLLEPSPLTFETGAQTSKKAKLSKVRGQNITLKVSTVDKIDELQSATITMVPKAVK